MFLFMKNPFECPFPKVFPSQLEKGNLFFMQLAYNEAINAWNDDEVPVGAVIARGDEVIASAFNQTRKHKDPTAHAEMIAMTMAAKSTPSLHASLHDVKKVRNHAIALDECFAGDTALGILLEAGVQHTVRNRIGNFVRMPLPY